MKQSPQRLQYCIDEIYAPDNFNQRRLLRISGWVTWPAASDPLHVELRSDNVTLTGTTADRTRPDVVRTFHATQGELGGSNEKCGFQFATKFPRGARHLQIVAQTPQGGEILVDTPVERFFGAEDHHSSMNARIGQILEELTFVAAKILSPRKWARRGQHLGRTFRLLCQGKPKIPGMRRTPYETHVGNNEVTPAIRQLLSRVCQEFDYQPKISIVMPVYNVDPKWLVKAVGSVQDQIYPHWELSIADDASPRDDLRKCLQEIQTDERIKVFCRTRNGGICAAANSAAELTTGEYLVFMDNDDALAPHALFEFARVLQDHPDFDLMYSDEDKIDENDRRFDPQFKPDWSPEMFLSYNYVNHLVCLRRSLFEDVGRFRLGYEGAQDYDLLLRAVSETERIYHIPNILYHWRALPSSTARSATVKPGMYSACRAALEDHCRRHEINASVYEPQIAQRLRLPIYQLDWPDDGPAVAILIPAIRHTELLRTCVDSVREKTTYRNLRIVIIDNDSDDPDMLNHLEALRRDGVEVLPGGNEGLPTSDSRLMNQAVEHVPDELVLLLSPDTEVVEPQWLSRMVGYLSLPGVGATGARLLCADGTIQHAGLLLRMSRGIAPEPAFENQPATDCSYYFQAEVARNCSAVTSVCLLTRRDLFLQLGGLDEEKYPSVLSDVDYCLRLQDLRRRVVYVAGAELLQHHSRPPSLRDHPHDFASFRKSHGHRRDPYYNPNLSRSQSHVLDPRCHFDYAHYRSRRVQSLFVTHNLNLEGATKALYEIATGLNARGKIEAQVLSPVDGPLRAWYEKSQIDVNVDKLPHCANVIYGWRSAEDYRTSLRAVRGALQQLQPEVIVANTLHSFYVVKSAAELQIPVIWIIYESYSQQELFRQLNSYAWNDCYQAFAEAKNVVFVSTDTCELYRRLDTAHNFVILHNGIDTTQIDAHLSDVSRAEACARIGASHQKKIITMVGAICERKAQHVLVEAAARLNEQRDDFCCYCVGLRTDLVDPYVDRIRRYIEDCQLHSCVKLIPATPDVYDYFRASDIFVLCSQAEGYNLSLLEAEAFGLPIVTTLCSGVNEQVRHRVNALLFPMSDARTLADHLQELLDDPATCRRLGYASRQTFECLKSYPEMLAEYEQIIVGAR